MGRGRRYKRLSLDQISLLTFSDLNSVESKEVATQTYFGTPSPGEAASPEETPSQALTVVSNNGPSYTSTRTWKSPAIRDKEEFERLRQRVRHFAPEQFKANAKPGRGPCEIVPHNVTEWRIHQKEMLAIAEAENKRNRELLTSQIKAQEKIPKLQRKVKSVFGEGGKVFTDGFSPVLGIPTIWSAEYLQQPANWPSKAELQWNGDSRECSLAKTKCGRYLPPPRAAAKPSAPFQEQPFIRQLPLDETGPVFSSGRFPADIYDSNVEMDNDPMFEATGALYLGSELMSEIGEYKPAFVPDWRKTQPANNARPMIIYEEEVGYGTPDVGPGMWIDENVIPAPWDEQQIWY
ncbi:hypothetical protein H2200_002772 [Cladophialophora chaetospira]|uniref:Uncharacterized protein n=1 Tax=Cladophialophora chaetospira TaxID=386627 RepID=A0AA38XJH3_9EURO|nr:hypothetical protein H2200_002772 [Cladophialophora chaetospira]